MSQLSLKLCLPLFMLRSLHPRPPGIPIREFPGIVDPKIPGGNSWEFLKFWRELRGISRVLSFPPIFNERELKFRFAICRRPSVCHLSSVTFVRPTQAIEIFGNVFTPFGTLAIRDLCVKILQRSSQGNPSGGGLNRRGVAKYSDFRPFQGYISKTMQDRR